MRNYTTARSSWICQQLSSRALIRLTGTDAADYLQGLITNDMKHITEGTTDCMFAMFLNSKGRVLYDSLIYKDTAESFIIESDKEITPELIKHLKMFKVRRKISVNTLEDSLSIYNVSHTSEIDGSTRGTMYLGTNVFSKKALTSFQKDLRLYKDPRCGGLGYRLLSPSEISGSPSNDFLLTETNFYNELRYRLGIAEGIIELPPGNCFALESNCDYLHGVSFHKGCYLGQEVTARTHHTGVVRKRIMPLVFEKTANELSVGTAVKDHNDASVGKLRGVEENSGVGLLRIEDVLRAKYLEVDGSQCRTYKPAWWPTAAPKERPLGSSD